MGVMRRQGARGLHVFLPNLYNSGGRGLPPSCARCLSAGKVNGKRLVKHVKPPCTEAKLLSVRMTMMIGRNVIQPLLDVLLDLQQYLNTRRGGGIKEAIATQIRMVSFFRRHTARLPRAR